MVNVTTEFVQSKINESLRIGISTQFEINENQVNYLRMLVSKYNAKNGTEISVRKVQSVTWKIRAPYDRFIDKDPYKAAFTIVQRILSDERSRITDDELKIVQDTMCDIINTCAVIHKTRSAEESGHDILK